ncbi:Uncharacterized protein MSYG_1752 [Malassezia sympodialis ATCC 42132]|uniref:Uncharacterized protein n=1 Tax=Malassezia sympodialis (strain ATCC 42132) TaxID=1230383 RepID=A0A1M8A4M3_MALS4|nr:Uncharacterized protein MSYG_1752 [Malassezia sympodialis ATCC 42132]
MPTVGDWISLVLLGSLVYAIYKGVQHKDEAKKSFSERMRRLEDRGVTISSEGISIRSTQAAMDREAYLNATENAIKSNGAKIVQHLKYGAAQSRDAANDAT